MHAGQEARLGFVLAMTTVCWVTTPGTKATQRTVPILLERRNPIPGAFMTCTGMFGNGAKIGTETIHQIPR